MKKFIIIILIGMICFNGLVNERELNKLAIVSCIGIDLCDDGEYQLTVNVLDTKKSGGDTNGEEKSEKNKNSVKNVYTTKSSSIQGALREIVNLSSKKMYLAHIEVVMLSEKILREKNIIDILDYFVRDYEGGNDFILTCIKGNEVKEIIENLSLENNQFATDINENIKSAYQYIGNTSENVLNSDLRNILQNGKEFVISSLEVENANLQGNEEEKNKSFNIKVSDMGYFRNGKLIGFLEGKDNLCYNILNEGITFTILQIGEGKDRVVIEIVNSKVSMIPEVVENKYIVNIEQTVTASITEMGENVKIKTKEEKRNYEEKFENLLKEYISQYIKNCKTKYNSDIVGFKNLFYKYKYNEYKNVENIFYSNIYKNIDINVKVNVNIPNFGGVEKNW